MRNPGDAWTWSFWPGLIPAALRISRVITTRWVESKVVVAFMAYTCHRNGTTASKVIGSVRDEKDLEMNGHAARPAASPYLI